MKLPVLCMTVVFFAGPAVAVADKLDETYQSLKDAVAKRDNAQVGKLATELNPLVQAAIAEPAPAGAEEKEAWAERVKYAKGVGEYTEYAVYVAALGSPASEMPGLIATLEQVNPCSKYLDVVYGPYLVAVSKGPGGTAKATAIAEKALANFPDNEDLLLVMLESSMTRKQTDRALTYANKLTTVLSSHPKPEALSAAEWDRKKNAALARGYWVSGVIYGEKGNYAAADKKLRSALPLIKGNDAMMGPALFYLGMSNYQLGKMTLNKALVLEAAKFSEQASAIEGPYADQARHNALVMKADAGKMR
jgi:tetratricopeptide (TPR) repeat protein